MITSPKQLFTHHDAHPIAIYELLDRTFGNEWLVWDCDALWTELSKIYNVSVSALSKTKIQALRSLQSTKGFWEDWDIFAPIVQSLNNRIPNFSVLVKPTTAQMFNAVEIAALVREKSFSTEVCKFIAAVLLEEGVHYTIPPLEFVNKILLAGTIECVTCENKGIEPEMVRCPACGSSNVIKATEELPASYTARVYDIAHGKYDKLTETEVDILGARLKVAQDYLLMRREQLLAQMRLIDEAKNHTAAISGATY